MGSSEEENNDTLKCEGVKLNNWLFVKIDAIAAMNGNANLSLNNVYNGSEFSTYSKYTKTYYIYT